MEHLTADLLALMGACVLLGISLTVLVFASWARW